MPETIPAIEPIERRADEIEQYKHDSGEYPENQLPTGVFNYNYWQIGPGIATIAYLNFEGRSSDITNHLSKVTYEIIAGAGIIATKEATTSFDVGFAYSERVAVTIPKANRFWLEGNFSALVEWPVPPYKGFVTFGNEELSREARRELVAAKRRHAKEQLTKKVLGTMDFITPTVLEMQAFDRQHSIL